MSTLFIQEKTLTDIADSIRLKTKTSAPIKLTDFASAIANISGDDEPIIKPVGKRIYRTGVKSIPLVATHTEILIEEN